MRKQFGGRATKLHLEKFSRSKNWDGKKFVNLEQTIMEISFYDIPKLLYKQFCEKQGREPKNKIKVQEFNREKFLNVPNKTKFIWYGHSVVLMRMNSKTLLIDPMFGPNAAPISPFSVKRFSERTLQLIDHLPEIDLVLLSHDHYDHLDYDSIQKLKSKVKHFYVALGVSRHLIKWGVEPKLITEFDWWDKLKFSDIEITFTPSRHFSGRGLSDRAKSLWGGWAFKTKDESIWFSGDGGYGKHFKEIGKKLGPFDFAFMECGQYNALWHQIHMYPEESVQAAIDAGVKKSMAVHWAGFSLAQHSWKEPIERFTKACEQQQLDYISPLKGELVELSQAYQSRNWWEEHI